MPKTQEDALFTKALLTFVETKCGGTKALAAEKLNVPRQHLYPMLKGTVPCDDRKQRCVAILTAAGCYPGGDEGSAPESVTLGTENVTYDAVNADGLASVLRFLLDLVEDSRPAIKASPAPPQDREFQS